VCRSAHLPSLLTYVVLLHHLGREPGRLEQMYPGDPEGKYLTKLIFVPVKDTHNGIELPSLFIDDTTILNDPPSPEIRAANKGRADYMEATIRLSGRW